MKTLPIENARYNRPEASPLVEAALGLVREKVRQAWLESDLEWADFAVQGSDVLVTQAMMENVEQRIVSTGYRFDWSAAISVEERPEIYKPKDGADGSVEDFMFRHPDAPSSDADGQGRAMRGVGDNVVRHGRDVTGVARYIRSNERVLAYLSEGVPPGTIAVIDDSGGTLTAPILDQFTGVICAGGTVRSHLGILTREYNIPCLMNARITGIREGDRICIETTAAARTTEDYQNNIERPARVWLLGEGEGGQ